MRQRLAAHLEAALRRAVETGALPELDPWPAVIVEKTRDPAHGDYACGVAMGLARVARRAPRAIAEAIVSSLPEGAAELVAGAEVAGPGFINLRLTDTAARSLVREVREHGEAYGSAAPAEGAPAVLVEFVSANPTGPLHVGHGRGAVYGDAVASLLEAAGHRVEREYYVNDVGNQMEMLGRSLHARVQQSLGLDTPLPEDGYKGEYLLPLAESFAAEHDEALCRGSFEDGREDFISYAREAVLETIRRDLDDLGVSFDTWYREHRLHDSGRIKASVDSLRARDIIYEKEGALLFRTTDFGDEEDRVVIRADGRPTYFAADIAYHIEKLERGFDLAIDVWGADHHGYVPRVKAGLEASGVDPDRLEILMVQFVTLVSGGTQLKMSTRSGQFCELRELVEDVGSDAARFFFLMRRSESHQEFDLELAKARSLDNPVFYVQYGHARLCSILRKGAEQGVRPPEGPPDEVLEALTLPEERALCLAMCEYPHVVARAADAREPHQVVFYLNDTIKAFHSYYTRYKHTERVLDADPQKAAARLTLVDALRVVIRNGLSLLRISAPERMEAPALEE